MQLPSCHWAGDRQRQVFKSKQLEARASASPHKKFLDFVAVKNVLRTEGPQDRELYTDPGSQGGHSKELPTGFQRQWSPHREGCLDPCAYHLATPQLGSLGEVCLQHPHRLPVLQWGNKC